MIIVDNALTEQKRVEDALQVSETRYRRLFEMAQDGILLLDADSGQITDVNPFLSDLIGYSKEELLNKKLWDIGFFKDINKSKNLFLELKNKEYVRYEDLPLETKDGRSIDVEFVSNVYQVDSKKTIQCNVRDITERKRAEEALKSERLFSSLVQHSAIATFVVDPEHKVLNWNKACEELTGVRAEEVIGTSNHWQVFYAKPRLCLADVIIDNETEILDELYEIHAKSKLIPNGLHAEGWYPDLGGKDKYILFDAAPIYGINGKLIAAIETLQDITERKLAEEELRKTRNYLENLIDYANAPIIVWDPSFSITRFNHAFEQLTGLKADEVLGEPLIILFPESSREESMAYIKRTLSGEHWEVVEIPILSKDGSVRTVLWNSANIQDKGGKIIATIAQGTDITERKRSEKALLESEERYRAFFKTSRDCIYITSVDGRWIDLNDAAVQFFGYDSREDLLKVEINDLYANPEERTRHLQVINEKRVYTGVSGHPAERGWHDHQHSHHVCYQKR